MVTCLVQELVCLCLLCNSVYPHYALSPHRPNELHYDFKKPVYELPWIDFTWYQVKPYGNAYSLSPLDGAESCSPPLCLRAEKSLLKLFQGAKEASLLPRVFASVQENKVPSAEPSVFSYLFQVEKLSMW